MVNLKDFHDKAPGNNLDNSSSTYLRILVFYIAHRRTLYIHVITALLILNIMNLFFQVSML